MAISQSKKQSDLEKRLQILRRQVYGKSIDKPEIQVKQYSNIKTSYNTASANPTTLQLNDLNYLHQDLFKILVLSILAIGAQVTIFFLLQNNILKLNFI